MSTTQPQERKPVFVLSHPRTASNLFMKFFQSHPEVVPVEYPFINSFLFGTEAQCDRKGPERDAARIQFQENKEAPKSYHEAFKKLEEVIRRAGEQPSVIDSNIETPRPPRATPQLQHNDAEVRISTNPTLLPDDFMLSVSPVFLIRHPALVFPSWYKISTSTFGADIDDCEFPVEVSFRWSRILYDWYLNTWSKATSNSPLNQHPKPAVIDADDTMSDRAALERLCQQLQLDPQQLSFEWQVAKTGFLPWLSSIQKSTGVDMSKLSKGVDTQQEFVKWEHEFGSHVAQKLLHFVELAMPDYEYLLAQRG
ncbi:hypothetical protein V501_02213 [Pseudogymnoascus sp. VKM F-4519 (FW-2642)]|nr:hypothetical protein V501_02213 [Pseudogymnoascus sp. VKM F-4519 (FW-2642)]